jgi:hypothetical protein
MSSYWIMDAKNGVLGPVGFEVLRELAGCGRLNAFSTVSTNGTTWQKLSQLSELAPILKPPADERRQREQREAARILELIERYRHLEVHELFGVPKGSDLRVFRQGFVALAKPFHPAKLPRDMDGALLQANMKMFQFLTERLAAVTPVPVVEVAPPPPPAAATAKPTTDAFIGFSKGPDGVVHARVSVTLQRYYIFSEHRLINLSSGGVFLPATEGPRLGSVVLVEFMFLEPPPKDLRVRGTVIFEALQQKANQQPGLGVRLERLSESERQYLNEFVQRGKAAAAARVSR